MGLYKYTWQNEVWNGVRIDRKRFQIDIDFKFWAIIPAFNLNLHSFDLEFEWLFLGIYWNFYRKKYIYTNVVWEEPKQIGNGIYNQLKAGNWKK